LNHQGAKAFLDRGSPPPVEGQTPVVVYFQTKSSYWKQVYEEPTLTGLVYRERMALALGWIEELGFLPGSRMLDAGCGAGLTAVSLALRGYQVDALDAAQRMIDVTRELARENGVFGEITARTGSAKELPYEDGTFALVVALGLLPWFPDPDRVIREIARVLKPGGYALLTADNRWCLSHLLDPGLNQVLALPRRVFRKVHRVFTFARNKPESTPAPPAFRHSSGTIDKWICDSGLSKVRSTTLGFGPFMWFERPFLSDETGTKLHLRLQRLADQKVVGLRSTGWHYVVLGQKPDDCSDHEQKRIRSE